MILASILSKNSVVCQKNVRYSFFLVIYSAGVCFRISKALLSWSGHEVGLFPQRMPFVIAMTSSMWRPCARRATPTVLPGHPPTNSTCWMMLLSSAVMLMQREHVPIVVYCICFVFIILLFTFHFLKALPSCVGSGFPLIYGRP